MATTPAPAIVQLQSLAAGTRFTFQGTEYIKLRPGRGAKDHIVRVSDRRPFSLAYRAGVTPGAKDMDLLAEILSAEADKAPSLRPGTKVRIVDNQRTRNQGIAGVETVIERTNPKTYGLANGWRVSPQMVEEIK